MPRKYNPSLIQTSTGQATQSSVDAGAFVDALGPGLLAGVKEHLTTSSGAHPASAITTTGSKGVYDSQTVQGNLDELSALVPPRPPTIGNFKKNFPLSGVPDWGVLKMLDSGLVQRGLITCPVPTEPNEDTDIFPYWWRVPQVAPITQGAFLRAGEDPSTDPVFNLDPSLTPDPTYTGGGPGLAHQGGYTYAPAGVGPIIETTRLVPGAGGINRPVVVSGIVYPADRGVIALLHWPERGTVVDFLAQPLTSRCLAALRLGFGVNDGPANCDGESGGIFVEGATLTEFPSRSTGQYHLVELHTGLEWPALVNPLPAPYNVPNPSAGQVRLGIDPDAGVPPVPGGIPILGGTTASTGGGNDNNFFAYRLPYLADYGDLEFTPEGDKPRFFSKFPVSQNFATDLTTAGGYPALGLNYWEFQVARYRHRFEFPKNAPVPPDSIEQGTFLLLHFKKEEDFEALVRDGTLPSDAINGYELWSAALVDDATMEDPANLTTGATTSPSYHIVRAAVLEDPTPLAVGTVAATWDLDRETDNVVFVSGVQYFVHIGAAQNWSVNSLTLGISDLWTWGFNLGRVTTGTEITSGLGHQCPLVLHVAPFGAEAGVINPPTITPSFDPSFVEAGRLEFNYNKLDSLSGHGAWTLANGPLGVDTADLSILPADPLSFDGDVSEPRFSTDAKIRAFAKKPLGHGAVGTTSLAIPLASLGGNKILFHSTRQSNTSLVGDYGNFLTAGVGSFPRPGLENPRKDVEERFLDEVYRYLGGSIRFIDNTWDGSKGNLTGPGLPFPPVPQLDIVARIGSAPIFRTISSWLVTGSHTSTLVALIGEAQIAGLPDRSPPLSDGVVTFAPSRGILQYPKDNYSVGFRPSVADGDVTAIQPDYSGVVSPELGYLRVFDAGFSKSPVPVAAAGGTFFLLRVHGLTLADIAYSAPGPGSSFFGIEIKIPGLTTWMDAGRPDGGGPSKQDPLADGAGCKVFGPDTFDGVDPQTGIVFCQTKIHVGPNASLFINSDGEVPVMVRARVRVLGKNIDFTQGGATGPTASLRGLVGLEIVRPT